MNFDRIIFNYHSLPFPEDHPDMDGVVIQFIDSYNRLRAAGVRTVLIYEEKSNLWGSLVLQKGKTFGRWLVERGRESRAQNSSSLHEAISLFKKSITQYNLIKDVDYSSWPCMSACFSEQDLAKYVDSPVLMAAEKYQLTILSMASTLAWQKSQLQVIYTWMLEKNGILEERNQYICNHTTKESIAEIKKYLLQQRLAPDTIIQYWHYFFPGIERGIDVDEQLRELACRPQYAGVLQTLLTIAHNICPPKRPTDMHCTALKELGIDASDESDTTKHTYGKTRDFRFQGGNIVRCCHHLKFGDGIRLHYYVDTTAFHIGYVGSHLPI